LWTTSWKSDPEHRMRRCDVASDGPLVVPSRAALRAEVGDALPRLFGGDGGEVADRERRNHQREREGARPEWSGGDHRNNENGTERHHAAAGFRLEDREQVDDRQHHDCDPSCRVAVGVEGEHQPDPDRRDERRGEEIRVDDPAAQAIGLREPLTGDEACRGSAERADDERPGQDARAPPVAGGGVGDQIEHDHLDEPQGVRDGPSRVRRPKRRGEAEEHEPEGR
jgi:hypothetical protein